MIIPVVLLVTWFQFYSLSGANLVDQHMINNMVGLIIEQLTARFPESVQLGDMSSSHLFGKARFEAALGSMKSVHSLERSGDVIFEWGNREVTVTLTVTFTKLEVTYEEYSVSVVGMTTSGRLKTTAFNNLFRIVAVINDYSECFVMLKRFDVLELGNFQINLYPKSGNLLVGWLSSSTVTSAVNFFKERIRSTVEKEVRQVLLNQITPSKFVCIKFPRAK